MIQITRPDLTFDEVADDLRQILASGRLTDGPVLARFESALSNIIGAPHVVATTSATTALHLSLVALGIGPGDEVLVSDFSFPASANAIVQCGAVPVFVDCRQDGFDLDLVDAGKRVSARTRAIMPVHPFGMPADIVAISQLASKHGLLIIEDAACALGASREGISCGNGGNTGCFSFHPRKLVTTGEGGAIATTDEELSARLRLLRSHGAKPSVVGQEFLENGFNYRLSEISASLGLAQLHRFAPMIDDRRRTAQAYQNALSNFEDILMPQFGSPGFGTFQSFVVLLGDHVDRNHVVKEMRARKVETTLGTYAQHSQPAFARFGCLPGDLPHSLRAQRQSLTLPLLPHMGMEPVHYVVDALVASIHASYRNPSDETV